MENIDLTTPGGVCVLMASSDLEDEWNNNADLVKKANNGYPSFWFMYILLSGLADRVQKSWSK